MRKRTQMPALLKTDHPHIVRVEGVCGGEPIIDGLRVTVRHVVTLYQKEETVAEIADALNLTESQVFHALSYYDDHRQEIEVLIAQEAEAHARLTAAGTALHTTTH